MLGAGADFIVKNLDPLGKMIQEGFGITGVVPNNEAITSIAQNLLGKETMFILVTGLVINIIIARVTKYKYIFLTGHHSFFMACMFSAVLFNIRNERDNFNFNWWYIIRSLVSYISKYRTKIYRFSN